MGASRSRRAGRFLCSTNSSSQGTPRAPRAWLTARGLWRCAACERQCSATAGTIFAGTRTSLRTWFEALWLLAGEDGVSAEALRVALDLGSYQTAWAWLHKLRRAMAMTPQQPLGGIVELAAMPLLSLEGDARRHRTPPTIVGIAAEGRRLDDGHIRLARLPNTGPAVVARFVSAAVEPGARLRTTLKLSPRLLALGYHRDRVATRARRAVGLTYADAVAWRLEEWLIGTHQGAVRARQIDFYLAEFAFRYNYRAVSQGRRFARLLEVALASQPTPARSLVGGSGDYGVARTSLIAG